MFRPGSIRKIEVKNFVTYSHVELYPGPKLNMIIGPNGTGKSTIVAAIILGLGGNPKVVGRGSKVSDYVKHGCEVATINLHLQEEEENKFIKVTREFDTRDRTTWKLNNRKVTLKDVLNYIEQYNIQINNLCQFLPQDRVQEFAKLNKQDLLRETQKALCRFDLIEKQDALIKNRERHKQLLESVSSCEKKIEECRDLNSRLEGRVQSFNKKKEFVEKIGHIERKIAWNIYTDVRSQLSEVKKDKVQAQEIFERYKNEMKPIENEISLSRRKITDFQQTSNKIAQVIRNSEDSLNTNVDKINSINDSLQKLNDDMQTKLAEVEQWEKEIQTATNKLEEMKTLQREMYTKHRESEQSKEAMSKEMTKLSKLHNTLQDRKEEILQKKQDDILNVRALENESKRLDNVKQIRLQYLQKLNPDTYNAINWLRNNKHLFSGEIYEPIMLELNVLESKHAKYLENVIPLRDRLAFTCVLKEDMNKLITYLRQGKNLGINVVHSSDAEDSSQYKPNVAIEYLRKYGFYTYMNNLFTAPVPIMNYLCKTYRLHNIPLGDQRTDECYEKVPVEIRQFFSGKYRYNVTMSKYTGQKSVRQVEVGSDGSLSFSLDVVKMNNLKGQIEQIQRRISAYVDQCEAVDKQFDGLNEKMSGIRERMKEIQQEKQNFQNVSARVETLEKKMKEMKKIKKSPEEIHRENKNEGRQLLKSIPDVQKFIKQNLLKLIEEEKNSVLISRKIEEVRKKLAYLENSLKEKKSLSQEAEQTFTTVNDRYNEVMEEAKSMLQKAKSLSKGFTPDDDGFDEFRQGFENLGSLELEELNIKREQLQSRIACLNVANNGEMVEYEDRLKEIDRLTEALERNNTDSNKTGAKISKLEQEWLSPLNELLQEINDNFASAFERMGCAGEISICKGEDETDFLKYGISVKVTYRNMESLQELNSNVQSGGERAVATAAYMLSMQKLTPVPFRCVDEINQGMDANNERRIFELVVDSTCRNSSSQYFLITPKLIPHLNYSPHMLIHIVHNGPMVAQDKKWGFSKLCNPQKVHI